MITQRLTLFVCLSVSGAAAAADLQTGVSHRATYTAAFTTNAIYPRWDHDVLISPTAGSIDSADKAQSTANFYNRDGALVVAVSIWVPGASRVRVHSMAVDAQHRVLAGGNAIASDGKLIGFVTLTDFSGKPRLTITTNPYDPAKVCFGEDGSLWALVSLIDLDGSLRGTDYRILRHYSADGKLLQELLPRSRFAGDLPPALTSSGSGAVTMQANKDRLGIYFGHSNLWVEVDAAGTLREYPVQPLPFRGEDGKPTGRSKSASPGIAFLDSGSLYINLWDSYESGLYKLDKAKGQWVAVEGTTGLWHSSPLTALHGKDGNALVFSSTKFGSGLHWAAIE